MVGTYKQSVAFLGPRLAIDGIFSLMLIGLPFLVKHLLEYSNTRIEISSNGVSLKSGILSKTVTEVPFSKINSITVKKGLLGSILGYGDIIIATGNDVSGIIFRGIDRPDEIKKAINSNQ